MEMPGISVIVWLHDTNEMYFRDLLESLVSQTYDRWELYVLDQNSMGRYEHIVAEFFPEDVRAHYRQLKNQKGRAYAYNIGFHYVMASFGRKQQDLTGNYVFLVGQHDRLKEDALLQIAGAYHNRPQETDPAVIYMDHDILMGQDRMEPDFKPDQNRELLLHENYIGDHFLISCEAAHGMGEFREQLQDNCEYDFLLRIAEAGGEMMHIPKLLYHKRYRIPLPKKEERAWQKRFGKEREVVIQASMQRQGYTDSEDASAHQREYIFLHDQKVRAFTRNSVQRMYDYVRRKDVAVVGARFLKGGFSTENSGFLYDSEGNIFPAFYDVKFYQDTYQQLAQIPREVSMVDFRYCMIDAKIYRKLGGLDPALSGREQMLDFCLRARKAGYRTIIDPGILVRSPGGHPESSQASHEYFLEKWGETLELGDPYYNPNLPMGLQNYRLDMEVIS